jgi:hypothetical protein
MAEREEEKGTKNGGTATANGRVVSAGAASIGKKKEQ